MQFKVKDDNIGNCRCYNEEDCSQKQTNNQYVDIYYYSDPPINCQSSINNKPYTSFVLQHQTPYKSYSVTEQANCQCDASLSSKLGQDFGALNLENCAKECSDNEQCVVFNHVPNSSCILFSQDCTCSQLSSSKYTIIRNGPVLIIKGQYCDEHIDNLLNSEYGHTVQSCNSLCLETYGCVQFSLGQQDEFLNRCDLLKYTFCTPSSQYNLDYYRLNNCPPLTEIFLIGDDWRCLDFGKVQIKNYEELNLEACEQFCLLEESCVWFEIKYEGGVGDKQCRLKRDGCEQTESHWGSGMWKSYRPTGYIPKECDNGPAAKIEKVISQEYSQIFKNRFPIVCPVQNVRCQLLQKGCANNQLLMSSNIILEPTTGELKTLQTSRDGYFVEFCLQCEFEIESIKTMVYQNNIVVEGLRLDCSQSLIDKQFTQLTPVTYNSQGSFVNLMQSYVDIFSHTQTQDCPLKSCSLFQEDCTTIFPPSSSEIMIDSSRLFRILVAENKAEGINKNVCYQCLIEPIGQAQITFKKVININAQNVCNDNTIQETNLQVWNPIKNIPLNLISEINYQTVEIHEFFSSIPMCKLEMIVQGEDVDNSRVSLSQSILTYTTSQLQLDFDLVLTAQGATTKTIATTFKFCDKNMFVKLKQIEMSQGVSFTQDSQNSKMFQLYLLLDSSSFSISIIQMFEWRTKTKYPICSTNVSICYDEKCSETSHESISFDKNNKINPQIIIIQSQEIDQYVWIHFEIVEAQVIEVLKVRIVVCNNINPAFSNIVKIVEENSNKLAYDVRTLFKIQESSCPIIAYSLVNFQKSELSLEEKSFISLSGFQLEMSPTKNVTIEFKVKAVSKVYSESYQSIFFTVKQINAQSPYYINISIEQESQIQEQPKIEFENSTIETPEQKNITNTNITEPTIEKTAVYELQYDDVSQEQQETLNSVNLPAFKEDSELTEEELENETFEGNQKEEEIIKKEIKSEIESLIEKQEEAKKKELLVQQNKQFRESGFSRTRTGYTFQGVNPADIDKSSKINLLSKIAQIKSIYEDPKMKMQPITSYGGITLDFNQKMLFPFQINQSTYNNVFDLLIISLQDGSQFKGVFEEGQMKRTLGISQTTDDLKDKADEMVFNPRVILHTDLQIQIDLNIENPQIFSIEGTGEVKLILKQPSVFRSKATLKPIKEHYHIIKVTPPMISNKEQADNVDNTSKNTGTLIQSASCWNFVMKMLLNTSAQSLWGMIRAMQTIFLCGLVQSELPTLMYIFVINCIDFSSMDMLQGEMFHEKFVKFKNTTPINDKFDAFGIGDKSFINNIGSYTLVLCLITISSLCMWIINKIMKLCYKFTLARKIGSWSYNKSYSHSVASAQYKLYLETYFDVIISCLINLCAFAQVQNWEQFLQFFTTLDDTIGSLFTIIYAILCLVVPYYGFKLILNSDLKRNDEEFVSPWLSILSENIRQHNNWQKIYSVFFMIRKLLTGLCLVLFNQSAYFQCVSLLVLSFLNFIYLIKNHPFSENGSNRKEIFNEGCILVCSYTMLCILNNAFGTEAITYLGYNFIAASVINIAGNLIVVFRVSIIDIIQNVVSKYEEFQVKKCLLSRFDRRRYFVQIAKDQFPHFELELKIHDGIQFCKSFISELAWLKSNRINYLDLPEYKKHILIMLDLDFHERVRKVVWTRAIRKVSEILALEQIQKLKYETMNTKIDNVSQKSSSIDKNLISQENSLVQKIQKIDEYNKKIITTNMTAIQEVSQENLSSSSEENESIRNDNNISNKRLVSDESSESSDENFVDISIKKEDKSKEFIKKFIPSFSNKRQANKFQIINLEANPQTQKQSSIKKVIEPTPPFEIKLKKQKNFLELIVEKESDIMDLGMLTNFIKQFEYFEIDYTKDRKLLKQWKESQNHVYFDQMNQQKEFQNHYNFDLMFKTLFDHEISLCGHDGVETPAFVKENEKFQKLLCLDFMIKKGQLKRIVDIIYKEVTLSGEQKVQRANRGQKIVHMVNGNTNNSLQSVLQCLAGCGKFLRYILNFDNSKLDTSFDKKFSIRLCKVFSSIYRNAVRDITPDSINIQKLQELITINGNLNDRQSFDPEELITLILDSVNKESELPQMSCLNGSNQTLDQSYYQSEINKMFKILMTLEYQCPQGHQQSTIKSEYGIRFHHQSITTSFYKRLLCYLKQKYVYYDCKECKTQVKGKEQIKLDALPEYLIIYVDHYSTKTILKPLSLIPFIIDLTGIWNQGRDQSQSAQATKAQTRFKLISIISTPKAEKLPKNAIYTSIIKNQNKSGQWYQIDKDIKLIDDESRKNNKTQIAIYSKQPFKE